VSVETSRPRIVLLVVGLGLFLSTLDTGIVNVILVRLSSNFGISLEGAGLAITFYLFTLIVCLVPAGWLGDRVGPAWAAALGFVLFAAASLLCALSWSASTLIIGRGLQGIGAASLQANGLGLMGTLDKEKRGAQAAAVTAIIGAGPILGPALGGVLADTWGWRTIFLVNLPLCAAGVLGCVSLMRFGEERRLSRLDVWGGLLLVGLLSAFLFALYVPNLAGRYPGTLGWIVIGAALSAAFVAWERRVETPFVPIAYYSTFAQALPLSGAFAFGFSAAVLFAVPPVLFTREDGLSLAHIGLLCMAAPVGLAATALAARRSLDVDRGFHAMTMGAAGIVLALAALAWAGATLSPVVYVLLGLLFGVGGGWFQTANIQVAVATASVHAKSTAGGMLRLVQNVGIAAGAAVALHLVSQVPASGASVLAGRYALVWTIAAVVSAAFVIAMLVFRSSPARRVASQGNAGR
jgi:MFS family permease